MLLTSSISDTVQIGTEETAHDVPLLTPSRSRRDRLETPRATVLRCEGLTKSYPDGRVLAVRDVSLTVKQGDYLALTGASGSGKTSLLHLLGGLDRPTVGEVYLAERPLSRLKPAALDAIRAREIGFVFQSFHLLPSLTALENVQVPMLGVVPRGERRARAEQLLDVVGLADRRQHLPPQLSVGQRQRVAIARALANSPRVLLADEPTGNLDTRSGMEVLDLFDELRRVAKLTLVVITHSSTVADRADRVYEMIDGQLCTPHAAPAAWR